MFLTIKKKTIFAVLLAILFVAAFCATYFPIKASTSPKPIHTIVIDAGHGGKDGGAVGKATSVTESELNLKYALTLKKICEEYGFKVVLTRENMEGLYSPFAQNKKRSEMEKREEIINGANADVMVSIHMNSFPYSEARGAQVYYAQGATVGKQLADSVQKTIHMGLEYSKALAKEGDFYVLNCTQTPSILVECGFLSNPEEELLLQEKDYMQNFCYHLFCGVLMFFEAGAHS